MFVQDGALLDTNTSHVLAGRLKWSAQAFFRFVSVSSLNSNETNSLG